MIGNFFIWCAGSDKSVLSKCSDAERIKHIGFGTLVLIPAILAFVSMTYALSTIDKIKDIPQIYRTGGIFWGLIIFAFDRFIVSTHRKKSKNKEELKNIFFYLRLCFAFVLGVVISHPFVMLYFDGSITEKIEQEKSNNIGIADSLYQMSSNSVTVKLNELISRKKCLEKLLTAEQSGNKVSLDCGYSSGIPNIKGSFPRTQEIKYLIKQDSIDIEKERIRINERLQSIKKIKDDKQEYYEQRTSFDYLKRELALDELKAQNNTISRTQWFIMILLILVDILPVTFKTFAPFGMYDKILTDDINLLKNIDTSSRQKVLQDAYNEISGVYAENKGINKKQEQYKIDFFSLSKKYDIQRNILVGLSFGFLSFLLIILYFNNSISIMSVITIDIVLAFIFAIMIDFVKPFFKKIKNG